VGAVTDTGDFFDSAPPAPRNNKPGPPFEAQYGSVCSEILDDIQPGDTIMADGDGGFAHVSCVRRSAMDVIWE
jgi:hypothetical protein